MNSYDVPPEERKAILDGWVATMAARGRRVESQSDFQAILLRGQRVNHILHLILTLVTLLLWLPVWILLVILGGEKREIVRVDEQGALSVTKL